MGDVHDISADLGEPSWLRARREEAWKTYHSLSMPTTQDEAWRRTDIRSLPVNGISLNQSDGTDVLADLMQPLTSETQGALLVLQPGHAPILHANETLNHQGVVFGDWSTLVNHHPELLKKFLGSVVSIEEGKFAAAAAALAKEACIVYVPDGVETQAPLHSVLWAPGKDVAFFSRVLVVLGAGSSLTYIHETASPNAIGGSAVHAGIVELRVGEAAHLKFVELQSWGDHVWNFTHERALVERDGSLDWIFGAVGSHLTKNFSELTLSDQGAEGRISGFYFADGDQHLDHYTQQNHLAPHTTSDLLYKGALLDRSRSVWRGMIYVAPGAQKTDGYQANRNLILSEKARADSIPGLEILADDVRCSHGATVGQLEEEPVYYIMSRGLPRKQAERLVVDGFFTPIMDRVPFEGVRTRFEKMIDEKMTRNR
ncbi:MAG: Fe-S cluster assembly protein SufD [Chloroflexi bacterium RBG_16_48_8]|nr:MAG: Fe-S cluster assembly protein SufD [Chloroflexi bacterium RBG_16_48_8]